MKDDIYLGVGILFAALGVVYTLFFSLAPDKSAFAQIADNNTDTHTGSQTNSIVRLQENNGGMSGSQQKDINYDAPLPTAPLNNNQPLPQLPKTPNHIVSTQALFFGNQNSPSASTNTTTNTINDQSTYPGILYFPGTHHWRGTMKSAYFVGFDSSIKYVLKNNDNTHFAYIGKELPDVASGVAQHLGKTVAFTDKKDIHTHGLFGDKVIFLQVPQYLGKKQLFFVYFSEERDRWFIQVDDDIFETTKPLLRELFAKRYNR